MFIALLKVLEMTLSKTNRVNKLFDIYGCLLTSKQQEIIEYYYLDNYSYSEIAENLSITRAAVYDAIKKAEKSLEDYESKMLLLNNYLIRVECYKKLLDLNIDEVTKLVNECIETE